MTAKQLIELIASQPYASPPEYKIWKRLKRRDCHNAMQRVSGRYNAIVQKCREHVKPKVTNANKTV